MSDSASRDLASDKPRGLGLVLGGGGAKGFAHIVVLEALDDLGLRPAEIAGCSMGALIGACYASGLSGREIREFLSGVLANKTEVLRRLLGARVGRFADLLRGGVHNPVLIDAERFLDAFLPAGVPAAMEQLAIPLTVVAADFHAREEVAMSTGPLLSAVGASIAIPGMLRPVVRAGRVLIDGGALNPVPFNRVRQPLVVAVDVLEGRAPDAPLETGVPDAFGALFGAVTMMSQALAAARLKGHEPTVYVLPPVGGFTIMDFFKLKEILAVCEPVRDQVKRRVTRAIEATPAVLIGED